MDILWKPQRIPYFKVPIQLGNQNFDSSLLILLKQQALSIPHDLQFLNVLTKNIQITWVYWRQFGVFFVGNTGSHPCAMAMLMEYSDRPPRKPKWSDHDYEDEWYSCADVDEWSEKFLSLPGTVYLSTMGLVRAGRPELLTTYERHMLGQNITYLNS